MQLRRVYAFILIYVKLQLGSRKLNQDNRIKFGNFIVNPSSYQCKYLNKLKIFIEFLYLNFKDQGNLKYIKIQNHYDHIYFLLFLKIKVILNKLKDDITIII
jgi:hypothetical protein